MIKHDDIYSDITQSITHHSQFTIHNSPLNIDTPDSWNALRVESFKDVLMIVGAPDSGKSTFAQYLFQKLCEYNLCVGFLDGDPGQSALGPPSTMTLVLNNKEQKNYPPTGRQWRMFVGSISPARHMLQMLTCASQLVDTAKKNGAQVIVYDTCGLIEPTCGGLYLKLAKIDLIKPKIVLVFQKECELKRFILPFRRSRRFKMFEMSCSSKVQIRDPLSRRANRASKFNQYFSNSNLIELYWNQYAILPSPVFEIQRLIAMEDRKGFTLDLGIIEEIDRETKKLKIRTPLTSFEKVDIIRIGDIILDSTTYEDKFNIVRI